MALTRVRNNAAKSPPEMEKVNHFARLEIDPADVFVLHGGNRSFLAGRISEPNLIAVHTMQMRLASRLWVVSMSTICIVILLLLMLLAIIRLGNATTVQLVIQYLTSPYPVIIDLLMVMFVAIGMLIVTRISFISARQERNRLLRAIPGSRLIVGEVVTCTGKIVQFKTEIYHVTLRGCLKRERKE